MQGFSQGPVQYRRDGALALARLDNPPVNALSRAVRAGILAAIEAAEADPEVTALVVQGSARAFSAGADIAEFAAPPQAPSLADLTVRLAACTKPVLAVLTGVALGGGLELALACRYRLAAPQASLGLPEVKLGLIPGAGGTVRLPERVGLVRALVMIGEGEAITAPAALELGLVDALVPAGADPLEASRAFLVNPAPASRRTLSDDLVNFEGAARAYLARHRGLAAPQAVVTALRNAATMPTAEALEWERQSFATLRSAPESAAMRHLFFAERLTAKVEHPTSTSHPIETVGVIGAGTMGRGIAMAFANAGLAVRLFDADPTALARGLGSIAASYASAAARGTFPLQAATQYQEAIQPRNALAELADCDLVVEAAFEDLAVKQAIFIALDGVLRPGAILASNTSYLDINAIALATNRPESVLGLHFFSPAQVMKLVEVVRGAATAPDVLQAALQLAKRLKKVPVVVGVCPGFVGNRMLGARNAELVDLLLGGTTPRQIDEAFTRFGWAMGPFTMQDMAGLDISWRDRRAKGQTLAVADDLCAAGRFGQKAGAGYYRYEAGSRTPLPDPEVAALIARIAAEKGIVARSISDSEIIERTLYPMINEGFRILDEGIAARASDIDLVWVHGYGFPRALGGPLYWAGQRDPAALVAALSALHERSGKAVFRPAASLLALAQSATNREILP